MLPKKVVCPTTECTLSGNAHPSINQPSSLTHNSINMNPIDKAIEEIESLEEDKTFCYAKIAKKYGVVCTTLMRWHKGITASSAASHVPAQKLNPQQDAELVKYIESLTARRL
jgi:hypothetical protein